MVSEQQADLGLVNPKVNIRVLLAVFWICHFRLWIFADVFDCGVCGVGGSWRDCGASVHEPDQRLSRPVAPRLGMSRLPLVSLSP